MKTTALKMETTLYFPLLLLLCSLCSSEEHDNEILSVREEAEPRGRDLTNASDRQQACPRDIHNVLREMSALLAEQRVEIRHLQKDNEGTTVCEVNKTHCFATEGFYNSVSVGTETLSYTFNFS